MVSIEKELEEKNFKIKIWLISYFYDKKLEENLQGPRI